MLGQDIGGREPRVLANYPSIDADFTGIGRIRTTASLPYDSESIKGAEKVRERLTKRGRQTSRHYSMIVLRVIETDRRCVSLAGEAVSQCGVGGEDVHLAGEKASEGDAEAFLCHRRIRHACSSD